MLGSSLALPYQTHVPLYLPPASSCLLTFSSSFSGIIQGEPGAQAQLITFHPSFNKGALLSVVSRPAAGLQEWEELRSMAAGWLCHKYPFFGPSLIDFASLCFCSAGPQAGSPTSLCTLSMPSFHTLAQCLAEPKSPQPGVEALFTIYPCLLRHPKPLPLGTLSQGHPLLSPTPLTPTFSNKCPLLFST